MSTMEPIERPVDAPPDWDEMSIFEQVAILPVAVRDAILASLPEIDFGGPEVMLRPGQLRVVDSDEWITIYAGGRGAGKSRTGAAWTNKRAKDNPGCRIALLGRTVADVRDVMINGESGIIETAPRDFVPVYTPSLRKLEWPNGSIAFTYSSDSPSQLRGPQQHYLWADEMAAFRVVPDSSGATAWDNALLSTRLGDHPQLLITTTPKRTPVVRDLFRQSMETERTGVALFSEATVRNRANLSTEYIRAIHDRFDGTHLERQELHGELVGDSPGALWRSEDIVVKALPEEDNLVYVIGVDPSVGSGGSTTDDCGIIVVAATPERDILQRKAWVVEDLTVNAGPEVWTDIILDAQQRYTRAGRPAIVVCEGNQGGELLRLVLNQKKPGTPIAIVKAISSKGARAEPVVMAYRQKRVFHVEQFPKLEDEQTGWEPENTRGWSPGALDACVWGCHVLLVDPVPLFPFAPIIASARAAGTTLGRAAIPPWRQERKAIGMAVAPWRRR